LILRAITSLLAALLILRTTKSYKLCYSSLLILWTPAFLGQTRTVYTETLAAFYIVVSVFFYFHYHLRLQVKSNWIFLIVSSISAGLLALTRPVYQSVIFFWWVVEFYRLRNSTHFLAWVKKTFLYWVLPFSLIIFGWSFRNYQINNFFGLTAMLGFNMTSRTVSVIEQLPDTYAIEREILIRTRDINLLKPNHGHKGYLYWGGVKEDLQAATGLNIQELSKRLLKINLELIILKPQSFLSEVLTAFSTSWLPHVNPSESFGRAGQAIFSALQFVVMLAFLLSITFLGVFWVLGEELHLLEEKILLKDSSLLTMNWSIACIVFYTVGLSSFFEYGAPRMRIPVDPLIVVFVCSMLYFIFHARRKILSELKDVSNSS
jgi:hypothetical protein